MAATVLSCPSCRAPLTPPSRFARSVTCPYCSAHVTLGDELVEVRRFREALAAWDDPTRCGEPWFTVSGMHWTRGTRFAQGAVSEVFTARRARWPTEQVHVRVLRRSERAERFHRAWRALERMRRSEAPGAHALGERIPTPIAFGTCSAGVHEGAQVLVFRAARGFRHTLVDVRRAYPAGIDPRAAVWLWRRLLETLSVVHAEGLVHAALLPEHVLVEDGEHGARLVGWGSAEAIGSGLSEVEDQARAYFPPGRRAGSRLEPALDLALSARTVIYALGGDPARGTVPERVPPALAALLKATANEAGPERAWALREEIGRVSKAVFGAPSFNPLLMPR